MVLFLASKDAQFLTGYSLTKDNGAQTLADVVIPEVLDDNTLTVDGETVEVVNAQRLANRRYLWVPGLQAVFGGVLIFSGVHVWTADTATREQRAAWVAELDRILARNPGHVVPGHMSIDSPTDVRWHRPVSILSSGIVVRARPVAAETLGIMRVKHFRIVRFGDHLQSVH